MPVDLDDWDMSTGGRMVATPFLARALELDDGTLTPMEIRRKIQAELDAQRDTREAATPLEELCATVGLLNVKKKYSVERKERIPHDFRWVAPVQDLVFRGEPVLQIFFPPAKIDVIPASMQKSLALREVSYEVITGQGVHVFMGAVPGSPDIVATMMVVTPTFKESFTLSRTTIVRTEAPVAAWVRGGATFFDTRGVQWQGSLSAGDNIAMIDGDVWYIPEDRVPTVTIRSGRAVDRQGQELVPGQFLVPDGVYGYDLDSGQLKPDPVRPPVSAELLNAWKKLQRMPRVMYAQRGVRSEFLMDVQVYDPKDRSVLVENPRVRSVAMMRRRDKYREQCRAQFLRECSNVMMFPVWECARGNVWSMLECVPGRLDVSTGYWRLRVEVSGGRERNFYMPVGREFEFYRLYVESYGRFRIKVLWLVSVPREVGVPVSNWQDYDALARNRQEWWRLGYRETNVELSGFVRELW